MRRSIYLAILSFVCFPLFGKQGTFDLRSWDLDKDPIVNLDGKWKIHWQKLVERPTPGGGLYPSSIPWQATKEAPNLAPLGFATYETQVFLPESFIGEELVFSTLEHGSAYRLIVNGKTLFSRGTVGSTANHKPERGARWRHRQQR